MTRDPAGTAATGAGWRARYFDPLRFRLVGLMLLVLLVPGASGVVVSLRAYDEQTARAENTVHRFATLAADYERGFFFDTWRLLVGLAGDLRLPAPGDNCPRVFDRFVQFYPEYASLALIDPDGRVVCASTPKGAVIARSVADRDWFRRLTALRDFTLSGYEIGAGPAGPVMVAAQPIIGEGDSLAAVVAVTIQLSRLDSITREAVLPDEGVVYVLDRKGGVLTQRTGDIKGLLGLPPADLVGMVVRDEVLEFRAAGRDGEERAYSTVVLQGGDVHVLFGMPVASTFGWIERDLTTRLAVLAVTIIAGALAAVFGAHLLVVRWVRRLSVTAGQLAAGDLAARADLTGAPAELRELGVAFDVMAGRIAAREADLKRTIIQKDHLIRDIHHRVKNNLQTVLGLVGLRLRGETRPPARAALGEVDLRVRALALVQRHLHLDDAASLVDAAALLRDLGRMLVEQTRSAERLVLDLDLPPFAIDQDRAAPLALLVTELVTNALRHGLPQGDPAMLHLQASVAHGEVALVIADEGPGLAPETPAGLGLALVPGLVKQLSASSSVTAAPGQGTRWVIRFPLVVARAS